MPIAVAKCLEAIFVLVQVAGNMKNTSKITLCAVCAALSAVFMLTSYFPYLTYAIPAVAGLFVMVPLIETGTSFGVATYAVSAVLIMLFGEIEASLLYVFLFGYYPVLKAVIERIRRMALEWIIKLLCFNVAVIVAYFVSSSVFAVSFDDLGILGQYGAVIFLLLCNIVFVLYDIAISRVSVFYMARLHGKIKKMIK